MRVQFHFHTILSNFSHAHRATVMCVKWNHNGNWLTSAARDHLIKIFDIRIRTDVNSAPIGYTVKIVLLGSTPDGFDAVSVQNVGSTYIIVSWDLPTHSNGILINFSLYCNGALAGVLPLTVISYDTTGLLLFTLYMYITLSVGQVLQSRPQALHSSWNVVLGVISAAASLPRLDYLPYGGAYSQSPIPQLEQDVGMGHLSSHPLPQTGNPGSITEIECTLLSGSAEQDALTMKESPLKNLILFFLRPHPSWGWLQND
ncbi:hypothetical protein EMCRGX_G025981 [Ephydatia muelleri]